MHVGFKASSLGCRVQCLGCRVQCLGCRVQSTGYVFSGLRIEGLRVYGDNGKAAT